MSNPSTFKAEPSASGQAWDDHAALHRIDDGGGLLSDLKAVRQGTLAELIRFVVSLPENEQPLYAIDKAGDHRLSIGEILALSRRADFPRLMPDARTIADFDAALPGGGRASLADKAGKVLLVVNTASKCGFTPQYEGLEALWRKYRDRGFEVIGFPCNQFGGQEPGTAEEIDSFCAVNFGVSFPLMAKVEVNGPDATPLYDWLKAEAPGVLGSKSVKWNFTKFLIGRDGKVVRRYAPTEKPSALEQDIEALLSKASNPAGP